MRSVKMVLLLVLMTGVHAQGVKWEKLKALKEYKANAYTLKNGVEYLEIRNYYKAIDARGYDVKAYGVTVTMQKRPLNSFHLDKVKKFKASLPNLSKKTNIKK